MTRTIALVLLLAALPGTAGAQTEVEKLFARSRGLNPTLRDSSASLELDARASLSIVPYNLHLLGRYLFKRPNKNKVELQNAPEFLKKYPSVYGLSLPALERYDCKVADEGALARVTMTPRDSGGNIQRIELRFNRSNGTVPRFDTFYRNGHLLLNIAWVQDHGYWVYRQVDADLALPPVQGKIQGRYSGYRFNQGLSDDLFKQ